MTDTVKLFDGFGDRVHLVRRADYDALAAKLAFEQREHAMWKDRSNSHLDTARKEHARAEALAAEKAKVEEERDRWSFRADAYIIRAEAAEAALPAVYRLAMEDAAEKAERNGASPELNVANGGPEWFRHAKRIAAALRKEPIPTADALLARIAEETEQ